MIAWLVAQGVKQVVVACNTITMLGLESIKKNYDFDNCGNSRNTHDIQPCCHGHTLSLTKAE